MFIMKRFRLKHLAVVTIVAAMMSTIFLSGATASATASVNTNTLSDDYLHVSGSKILDDTGNQVRLTGIAWFGFETNSEAFDGIWSAKMEDVLDKIADNGFNLLRIPICVQLVNQWRNGPIRFLHVSTIIQIRALKGKNSLQVLDAAVAY
nr:CAZy families GH5 protein [uncultured Clostridium sp.]